MKYAAVVRVGIEVGDFADPPDESWHTLDCQNDYMHEWRFTKSGDFDVVVGSFEDPKQALEYAKRLYISVLYMALYSGYSICKSGCDEYGEPNRYNEGEFMKDRIGNEPFYIQSLRDYGACYGICIFEVKNSIEECKERAFYPNSIHFDILSYHSQTLSHFNIDVLRKNRFSFSKESQEILHSLVNASTFHEIGIEMTIYCGILEHLAPTEVKSEEELELIDELVDKIETSNLDPEKKQQMKNYLEMGRTQSSRQRCKNLASKHCREKYGKYKTNKIIGTAYNIRSRYAHGDTEIHDIEGAEYMKSVVMDVVWGVFSGDKV